MNKRKVLGVALVWVLNSFLDLQSHLSFIIKVWFVSTGSEIQQSMISASMMYKEPPLRLPVHSLLTIIVDDSEGTVWAARR